MESYTIFYSWQSDYDYSIDLLENEKNEKNQKNQKNQNETEIKPSSQRVLIQKLLVSKAYELGRKYKCNITVDQDTDDTPGMQPISEIVIKKIRNCHFFVCDITPVACFNRTEDDKWRKLMPNSNVMFELGIAMSYLPPDQIIAIAHETSGNWIISELPFDISHRKIIKFKSATDLEKDLSSTLESSLRYYRSRKGKWKRFVSNFTYFFKPSPINESETQKEQAALYNSEVFFNNRMSMSFPSIRGLKPIDIDTNMLKGFFKEPISNSDVSPMMIVDQSNKQYPIKHFKVLNNDSNDNSKKFLIGNTEVVLPYDSSKGRSNVLVYRHPENRSFLFLCIISLPQHHVECCNKDFLNDYCNITLFKNDGNNFERRQDDIQDYVIFNDNENKCIYITKELYEDISLSNYEESFSFNGSFEYRRRYLRKSILLIVPTDSVFDKKVYNDIIEILSNYYDCYDNEYKINGLNKQLNEYFQSLDSTKREKQRKMRKRYY